MRKFMLAAHDDGLPGRYAEHRLDGGIHRRDELGLRYLLGSQRSTEFTDAMNWASVTCWAASGRTPTTSATTKGMVFKKGCKFDRDFMRSICKTSCLSEPCSQAFDSPSQL